MYPTTTLFAHEDATSANNRPHFNGLSDQPLFKTGAKLVNDGFSLNEAWGYEWAENCLDSPPFTDGNDRKDEFTLHRREWANLNRLRTKHGRSGEIMHKWRITEDPSWHVSMEWRPETMLSHWMEEIWKSRREAFVQEWTSIGWRWWCPSYHQSISDHSIILVS